MNISLSACEPKPVHGVISSGASECHAVEGTKPERGLLILVSSVGWVLLGFALLFGLHVLMAREQSPLGTFISAFVSGGIAVLVSALSLRKCTGFKLFLVSIMAAYILRVVIGIFAYQHTYDLDYFEGQGVYKNTGLKNNEYKWTYDNVVATSTYLLEKGTLEGSRVFDPGVSKNPFLHSWMACFMAAGNSRHAMDLAPFNAFHHVIAGILVVGLALSCGYPLRVALLSGALTAWIPWGFPSSFMWRDSVGFAGVVLAVSLLCIGRNIGMLGSLLMSIPAAFLAWADRSPYLILVVVITMLSIMFDQQKGLTSTYTKIIRLIIVSIILAVGMYMLRNGIVDVAMDRHENHLSGLSFRLLTLPLLILRALAGPFPWFVGGNFDLYVVFDYIYHVLQFAVFLILIMNWRSIMSRMNILIYSAALFWVSAFIAGGVHTAYLAVAFPFIISPVLNTGATLRKYVIISTACFVIGNTLWITFGLAGSGLVLGTTGY